MSTFQDFVSIWILPLYAVIVPKTHIKSCIIMWSFNRQSNLNYPLSIIVCYYEDNNNIIVMIVIVCPLVKA